MLLKLLLYEFESGNPKIERFVRRATRLQARPSPLARSFRRKSDQCQRPIIYKS
jgi:hypothetical protein